MRHRSVANAFAVGFVLGLLAGLLLGPIAASAAVDQPAAMAVAEAHYGVPCGGAVAIGWAHLPGLNARADWLSDGTTFTACAITYSMDVSWDPQKFCTITEHEVGHLTGHQHGEDAIMAETYAGPSAECAAAFPKPIAWRPGPERQRATSLDRRSNPRYAWHIKSLVRR
jgi:hypothetical protein